MSQRGERGSHITGRTEGHTWAGGYGGSTRGHTKGHTRRQEAENRGIKGTVSIMQVRCRTICRFSSSTLLCSTSVSLCSHSFTSHVREVLYGHSSHSSMEDIDGKFYHYDILPDPKSSIRLLKILRSPTQQDQSQSLQCMIRTWYFNDMEIPKYHAISYTWGDTNHTKSILLRTESKGEDYILKAPQTSEKALRQAWQYDRDAWYWIDSICINQSKMEEKGHQVSIMGEIYSTAQCVLACVGDHSNESKELFRFARLHASFLLSFRNERHLEQLDTDQDKNDSIWKSCYIPPPERPLEKLYSEAFRVVSALRAFLSRPYFKRLWIYQELYLAKQVELCSEDDRISIIPLDALALLYSGDHWIPPGQDMVPPARHLLEVGAASMSGMKNASLWDLLDQVDKMDLQCRDVRDKLFGILAMVDWRDCRPIIPVYNMSGYEVAKEILMRVPGEFPRQFDLWNDWAVKIARIFEADGRFSFSSHGTVWMFVVLFYEELLAKVSRSYVIDLEINDAEPSSPVSQVSAAGKEYSIYSKDLGCVTYTNV